MLPFEDIHFQLVDLPAVSREHPVPWLYGALQTADGALLVVDLGDAECVEKVEEVHAILRERRVSLTGRWPQHDPGGDAAGDEDPFALSLPTLLLANKCDRIPNVEEELRTFGELTAVSYPALAVSAEDGHGLGEIGAVLFRNLGVVRAYTKAPGKQPDRQRPFTLRRGQTVEDVARLVHQDVARALRYARVWGKSGFDGQQVGRDHRLEDGDVVELHT